MWVSEIYPCGASHHYYQQTTVKRIFSLGWRRTAAAALREIYNLRSSAHHRLFYVKMNHILFRAYSVQNPQATLLRYFGEVWDYTWLWCFKVPELCKIRSLLLLANKGPGTVLVIVWGFVLCDRSQDWLKLPIINVRYRSTRLTKPHAENCPYG